MRSVWHAACCQHCKKSGFHYLKETLIEEVLALSKLRQISKFTTAPGCRTCTEGNKERVGIYQVSMPVSEAMDAMHYGRAENSIQLADQAKTEGIMICGASWSEKSSWPERPVWKEINRVIKE